MVKKSKDMANLFLAAKILGGTGGGEQPVLVTKSITENGIYSASADNADGYSQVTVDVSPPEPPADGKTRFYISLAEGRLSPTLGLGINGSVDVDWGDGTEHGTLTGSDTATLVTIPHTYAQGGDYIITLTAAEDTTITLIGRNQGSLLFTKGGTPDDASRVYQSSLKKTYLGNSVKSINYNAFQYCYSLASVSIPDSVTSIGDGAFLNCYGLGFIKFTSETPPTVANVSAWNGIPTDCIIYVPQGTLAAYTSATNYPDPATYTYVEY